jgi:hypothetical protein
MTLHSDKDDPQGVAMNDELTKAWKKFEDAREAFHTGQRELRRHWRH